VNAVPLFSVGSRRSESSWGNRAGTPLVGWTRLESFMRSLRTRRAASGRSGGAARKGRRRQIVSGAIVIAPQGHSATQMPQPLQ